jgi:hypothetical protein
MNDGSTLSNGKSRQAVVQKSITEILTEKNVEFPHAGVYTYEVTEHDYAEYNTTYDNASGTIAKDVVSSVTIHNARAVGNLVIEKTVNGKDPNAGSDTREFAVDVTLRNGNETVSGTFGDVTFSDGEATVMVPANGSVTISGIPTGYSYAIAEQVEGVIE